MVVGGALEDMGNVSHHKNSVHLSVPMSLKKTDLLGTGQVLKVLAQCSPLSLGKSQGTHRLPLLNLSKQR